MSEKPSKPKPKKRTSAAKKPAAKARKPVKTYAANPSYRGAGRKSGGGNDGGSWKPSRRALVIFALRVALACFIIGGITVMYFARNLPDISTIDTIRKQQGITIETADGHAIANYGDVYGEYIPYDQLPKALIQAVIATEDRRFFEHHGVDLFGIARAAFTNMAHGHVMQGGSTVTQQVAKNVFLTPERSMSRKMQEVLLAFWLEGRFTKKQIMAIYLNRVYLGSGTFGVDAAAHRYFNKGARELNLEECALMAGLLKAPSRYSPASNTGRAKERMHQVLLNMVDAGYLKQAQADAALASYTKTASTHQADGGDVRYFTDWILDDIPNFVGQVDEDMIVTTTFDPKLQSQAVDALQNVISSKGPEKNISQGALVAMTPNGAVKAMVGGVSYGQSQYNRAAQAKRQPGSVFKLFVYLAALEAGMTPESIVEDAPITLQVGNKTWSPDNYSNGKYLGQIPMVVALRNSLNTVSVRLSQYAGIGRVAQMAMRLGIPNIPERPSIALGAVEATLLEMTGAYAHLPNHGMKVEPYGIISIRTRAGVELYKREEPAPEQVLANGTVQMMNYMLLDVVRRGTGVHAGLAKREVAGKTGTSQDFKDAWFIGFTPQLVAGVWVGNDDNKPMKKVTGGEIPAAIWHDFMTQAMDGLPAQGIPNSPSNSDGLFPWLFGGDAPPPAASTPPAVIPEDSPFGLATPPADAPHPPAGVYAPAPSGQMEMVPSSAPLPPHGQAQPQAFQPPAPLTGQAVPPQAQPAPQGQQVLTPQFWNTLMEKPTPNHKPADESDDEGR